MPAIHDARYTFQSSIPCPMVMQRKKYSKDKWAVMLAWLIAVGLLILVIHKLKLFFN